MVGIGNLAENLQYSALMRSTEPFSTTEAAYIKLSSPITPYKTT
jgi:hypothetical protein